MGLLPSIQAEPTAAAQAGGGLQSFSKIDFAVCAGFQ
jgi:hypothetical protein